MKRNAFVLFLLTVLLMTGCQKLIARRDESQVVEFANKMPKGEYTLKIYKLDYPKIPSDRDAFYEKFSILMSKMVAHNKDINLIIPFELYQDIKNIGKRDVREAEKIYYKPASELTEEEKEFIDSKIDINYPENAGIFQGYLNKQVYYWLNYLKREKDYNPSNYYTELDKMKMVEEIFENRKMISKTFEPIENDFIIEVNSSNIEEAGKTRLPLYTESTLGKEKSILSSVIILKRASWETLVSDKIVLTEGMITENIKDYEFGVRVINIANPSSLVENLENEEKGLKIKDLKNFKVIKPKGVILKKASVKENEKGRDILKIKDGDTQWRIN
ncbi:hypothetical protein [Fusobacterium sp.]|uniref:hypothetical protein n=1 Tax=Fusobacterium sp. TaxID=68766 RepID=UPI0029000AAC|nr:hypothetical protein [Fusobacterium sp.]MDU1911864.1 hypothetical protein [Fusobacterium sp.]